MTATSTIRRRADARYRGVVYGVDVLDHHTGQIVPNDYVGKTRQRGRARENQHRDTQPFSDRIVGSPRVLWEGLCTDAELDEMERHFIQDVPTSQRPRLNWKLNEDNPNQIPKWVQVSQRHERDDAEGRPRWVPPGQRDKASLLEWDTTSSPPAGPRPRPAVRKSWSSRRKHLTGLGVVWLNVTLGAWIGLVVYERWSRETVIAAPITALAVIVWVWAGCPLRRRGRRKAMGRIRRRLQWRRRR